MFNMDELQHKLAILRNELREAGRDISSEIVGNQDETDIAGALLHDRMQQCQMMEVEEIARHADAMAAIRDQRDAHLRDYAMAIKAVDDRVRTLGSNLIEQPAKMKAVK